MPEILNSNIKILDIIQDAYEVYFSSCPDFEGVDVYNSKIKCPTYSLFYRFTSENIEFCNKTEILSSALLVVREIAKNPEILKILDKVSEDYLAACINQPVSGFTKIATLMQIAKQDNIISIIEKAKILRFQEIIKYNITILKNEKKEIYGELPEIVLSNEMLHEVHKKLLDEKNISQPWPGVLGNRNFNPKIKSFLTKENIDKLYNLALEELSGTEESNQKTIEFLCGFQTEFLANLILTKEELDKNKEYIRELKKEICDIDISQEDQLEIIKKNMKTIEELEKPAGLLEKTKDLYKSAQLGQRQDGSSFMPGLEPSNPQSTKVSCNQPSKKK
ncbi:hypothetical protein LBMAG18_07180 [Alphaproteobacteria bacterium]|nr:hypothetical protein LBMAG18_07180 [Alphaproteobacteria bacterium]